MKQKSIDKLEEELDLLLIQLEDVLHGEEGEKITRVRMLVRLLKASHICEVRNLKSYITIHDRIRKRNA